MLSGDFVLPENCYDEIQQKLDWNCHNACINAD